MGPRIEECLIRRATPMCWVTGPSGAGKTALEAALAHHADTCLAVSLSTATRSLSGATLRFSA